jgi:putative DNA primase/helicase
VVVERLLSITSRDRLEVEGKYLKPVSVQIPARLMICTNEVPNLRESSGALAGRFHPLLLTRSFYGKEDLGLGDRIIDRELSGILKWAVHGLEMLREDGQFIIPKTAVGIMDELMKLTNPLLLFVEECCDIGGDYHTSKRELHYAYQAWCKATKRIAASDSIFLRNLYSAFENLSPCRPEVDGRRVNSVQGIRLNHEGEEFRRHIEQTLETRPRFL